MKPLKIFLSLALLFCAACSAPVQPPTVEPINPVPTQPPPTPSNTPELPSPTPPANLASTYPDRPDCIPAGAAFETGQAVRVIDGDTIEVFLNGQSYSLRYIGIDSPEIQHPQKGREVFGPEAAAQNQALVQGKQVVLVKDISDTDSFGRLLRYVFIDSLDGPFVNARLVQEGFARASRYPPNVACAETFQAAEQQAQAGQLGVWSPVVAAAIAATTDATMAGDPTTTVEISATADATAATAAAAAALAVTPASRSGEGIPGGIEISTIFYDGSAGDKEPDEYVEINNRGSEPIQLRDWSLEDKAHHRFVFPEFEMTPDQVCRIYTNQEHPEWCGFSFRFDESAIWNNGGDCAYLADSQGQALAEYCYEPNK